MPRTSAEERSASFYQADRDQILPPKNLSARARAIWRSIVSTKPVDWFDAGQEGLLAEHCRTQVRLERLWVALDGLPIGSIESHRLTSELKVLTGNYGASLRMLRLTVQQTIERHEAKAKERQTSIAGDNLLGCVVRNPKIRVVE